MWSGENEKAYLKTLISVVARFFSSLGGFYDATSFGNHAYSLVLEDMQCNVQSEGFHGSFHSTGV
jgi:hypothetical protein